MTSEAVQREWFRRIEAEYRSAALTQHLTLWLIQAGASPDLIEAGLRIVADELAHSELSHAVYREAGGSEHLQIVRERLELPRTPNAPIERDLLLVGVNMFCLGETIAVRLFSKMRAVCEVPTARQALDRILKDEVFHRDFGWALLEWLLSTPASPQFRALLDERLAAMLQQLRNGYAREEVGASGPPEEDVPLSDQRWGLIPRATYSAVVEETFKRDYVPRFAELGVRVQPR